MDTDRGAKGAGPTTGSRIGFLANVAFVDNCGIGRYQTEILRRMRGVDGLHLFVDTPWIRKGGEAAAGRVLPGVPVSCFDAPSIALHCLPELLGSLTGSAPLFQANFLGTALSVRNRFLFGALVDKMDLDLFHATGNFVPRTKGPVRRIITMHDTTPVTHPHLHTQGTRNGFLQQADLRPDDLILTVSQSGATDFLRAFDHPRDQVQVAGTGIDLHLFRPAPAGSEKDPAADPYLLTVGTIEPRKNLLKGLRAFEQLAARHPKLRWSIVGGWGWRFEEFVQALSRSPCRARVQVLTGLTDEQLVRLYQGAEAVFYPSLQEGFGLPMIEGFACGVPVVASDIPVFREVGGEAARYFDPEEPREMADALEAVVGDEPVRARMVERGAPRVKRHAWDLVAQEHLRIYARALGLSSAEELFERTRNAIQPIWARQTSRRKEKSTGS